MEALKYLKELDRMCRTSKCDDCGLSMHNNHTKEPCGRFKTLYQEETVKIVEKWSLENPEKTILQDFLEKYPNAKLNKDGLPLTCARSLGYIEVCKYTCQACWNRPLEG